MVSIRLPGMTHESPLRPVVWTPELSDDEIRGIKELSSVEGLLSQLEFKMIKLEDSNVELKRVIRNERIRNFNLNDNNYRNNVVDNNNLNNNDNNNNMSMIRQPMNFGTVLSDTTASGPGSGQQSSRVSPSGNESILSTPELIQTQAPQNHQLQAQAILTIDNDSDVNETNQNQNTTTNNHINDSNSNTSPTVTMNMNITALVEREIERLGIDNEDNDANHNDDTRVNESDSSEDNGPSNSTPGTDNLNNNNNDSDSHHYTERMTPEETFELVKAVFENTHILEQMAVRRELLKKRIETLTVGQGMTL